MDVKLRLRRIGRLLKGSRYAGRSLSVNVGQQRKLRHSGNN
jgi:hypothetical protein